MKQGVWAVLIADVVESRARPDLRRQLAGKLRIANKAHLHEKRIKLPYAVTAGDEFQTIAARLEEIPGLVLDLRRRFRPLPLRIGIGIGQVSDGLRPPVNQLAGPAFQLARRAIEDIKTGRAHKFEVQTAFRSIDDRFDSAANLVYGLHDTLIRGISEEQWRTIDAYLAKGRVDRAAKAAGISGSTASRNLRRAHFWQIEETIAGVQKIVRAFF